MSKIIWTDEEQAAVKAKLAEATAQHPDWNFPQLAELAQEGLPPARRRRFLGASQLPWNYKPRKPGKAKAKAAPSPRAAAPRRAKKAPAAAPEASLSDGSPEARLLAAVRGMVTAVVEMAVEMTFAETAARLETSRARIVEVRAAWLKARSEGREADAEALALEMRQLRKSHDA